jgi:TonB family protein
VIATVEIPFGEGWLRRPKEGVYRAGGNVLPPRPLHKPEPEYTEAARAAKIEGTVVLYVEIWPDGRAHNVRLVRSLDAGLDQKAIETVEEWIFQPGQKDGQPVTVGATIEINFRLT